MKNKQALSILLVILAGISWSFAGVLGKFTDWSPLSIVGFRCVIATLILGAYRRDFRPKNTKGNWIGALGVIATSALFIYANKKTSPANAIVLQYAMTAIVIVLQAVIFKMRLRRLDVLAAVFVLGGVVLCFCQNFGGGRMIGDIAAILSAFTWAAVFLAARMEGADSASYSYMGNLLGCVFLISMFFDPAVRGGGLRGALAPAAMGVCNALGYLFFALGMRRGISPAAAAVVSNIEPVLNPTWVFIFCGEDPGALSIIGAAVVLITVTVYSLLNSKTQNSLNTD